MSNSPMNFGQLIDPLTREVFFEHVYGQQATHIPGSADKFGDIFSWEALNGLLNMTKLWSDRTMSVVLDGERLRPAQYCSPGESREGAQLMLTDTGRVFELLKRGATLVLNSVETLDPGIAAVARSLQLTTGAATICNIYCSWKQHAGFDSHFDTMDVFALQITGTKTWNLYEGRYPYPAELPGHTCSYPSEHRNRMKGNLMKEVHMQPGDVLYIPKGMYHDAIATSDGSLHLSYGVTAGIGQDLISLLVRSLPNEPLFRQPLPHFDDEHSHRDHVKRLADRLYQIMTDPKTSDEMRRLQQERAHRDCFSRYSLPNREPTMMYRVCSPGASLQEEEGVVSVAIDDSKQTLSSDEVPVARWILQREAFTATEPSQGCSGQDPDSVGLALNKFRQMGLIDLI